ncbi:integral membrane protein [Streptomyces glaucescens]|uniref:Integral membrane protein n=1 Tax=Streptomyces glaucescens TaxID=1907 RepID=A0A089X9X5_STRGA|nr:integral membrane protein [Streptomyces glaucescens]
MTRLRPRAWRPRTRVLLLAAVFAVLQLANVTGRDTPDTKNYLSYALSLRGDSKREAAAATIDYVCAGRAALAHRAQNVHVVRFHRPDPAPAVRERCGADEWRVVERRLRAGQTGGHTVPYMPERFMRIFEARPGYPVFLLPFVSLFGVVWGVWTASVVVAAAGGVLVFLVLRSLRVPSALCLTGQGLYYVLPVGTTAMRPMTEGLMLALTLAAVWGCALVLGGRHVRAGLVLVGGSLAALFTVKHSQALFLGVCLAAAATLIAVRRWRRGRPPGRGVLAVAAAGLAATVLTVLLARLLGYPSTADSVQDLLTHHFARPDRADPWPEFWQLQGNFWMEWLRRQLWQPLFLAALAAGAWGAARRPAFGVFLAAAAFTGILTQAGHPDIGIWGERLIVLAWLLPVVGVPLLLDAVLRRPVAVPAQGHSERAHSMR